MIANRGAVMVESALAVSLLSLFIYGSVQLGMVGLEQLTVDGGAYTAAHQQALLGVGNPKNYEDAPTLAKATLPHLNAPTITVPEPGFGPAPAPSVTPDLSEYGLSKTNARHGGVSMIQPVQTVSVVQSQNFASLLLGLGNSISVTGLAIDPAFRLINGHGDVSGNDFYTAGAFATASDPFTDGNNAPPYFVGFNYMKECPFSTAAWTTNLCPASPIFAGLGLAEYLDVNNWGRPVNGVIPNGSAVFYETRLHQDTFANIANDLAAVPASSGVVAQFKAKAALLNPVIGTPGGDPNVQCAQSFDNLNLGSYSVGVRQIGDFPLNPGGDPAVCAP